MLRKLLIPIVFTTAAGFYLLAESASGLSSGFSGYSGNPATNGGATCASCHTGGIAPGVALAGPLQINVGATGTYTFTITGGQAAGGGLDVSATAGTLVSTAPDTKIAAGEIVHNAAKTADATGAVTWTFDWTAPTTPGTVTIYAAGNSVDLTGSTTGDAASAASITVTVSPPVNSPPTALTAATITGVIREGLTFDGSGSTDTDGTITAYRWDFGDGSPIVDFGTLSAVVQHSYMSAGAYTATLTVVDDQGATNSASVAVDVGAGTPPPASTTTTTTTLPPPTTTAAPTTTTTAAPTTSQPASSRTGVEIFNSMCASCHGASGNGGVGPSLVASTASTAAIRSTVLAGKGIMPGFSAALSPAEVTAITGYVSNLQQSATTGSSTTSTTTPATGSAVFETTCAACHGPNGEGGIGPSLVDSPISPALVKSIVTNGLGDMPALAAKLTPEQIQLVADYVAARAPALTPTTSSAPETSGATNTPTTSPPDPGAPLFAANCASCHGAQGEGDIGPSLQRKINTADIIDTIEFGSGDMPAFGQILTAVEIQQIADHVRVLSGAPATEVKGEVESNTTTTVDGSDSESAAALPISTTPGESGSPGGAGLTVLVTLGIAALFGAWVLVGLRRTAKGETT